MPEVTREQLVDALQEFHLWITSDRKIDPTGRSVFGTVQDPESFADGLLLALRANTAHEADGVAPGGCCGHADADPELTAIAVITGQLESLAGTSGAGIASATRVLAYTASRYGHVLADED